MDWRKSLRYLDASGKSKDDDPHADSGAHQFLRQYEQQLKDEEEEEQRKLGLFRRIRRMSEDAAAPGYSYTGAASSRSFSRSSSNSYPFTPTLRRRNTFPNPKTEGPQLAYLSSQYSVKDTPSYCSIPECASSTSSLVEDVTVEEAARAIAQDEQSWNEVIQTIRKANVVTSVAASMICVDIFRDKAKEMTEERIRKAEQDLENAKRKEGDTLVGKMKRRLTLW